MTNDARRALGVRFDELLGDRWPLTGQLLAAVDEYVAERASVPTGRERLTDDEVAALRSLPRHGSPYEINGAIERDAIIDHEVLSDAAFYDRRILLVTLRAALAARSVPAVDRNPR